MASYSDDVRALETIQKVRYAAFITVFVSLLLTYVLGVPHLDAVRALAWAGCAYTAVQEVRICKRIGRSPDMAYLRLAAYVCATIVNVVL